AGLLLCSQRLESRKVLALVNWQLLVLFIGLFVVVGAFAANGFAGMFREILFDHSVNLHEPSVIAIVSAALSNLINNSAAVMLLIQMIDINVPANAYALAISNAFAGNLLLIGSMTNLVAAQSAESCGVKIGFLEFARYGIPVSLASLGILLLYLS
ncbi:MAG: SLC13 family permease, partial [Victivallaceae bacterium]